MSTNDACVLIATGEAGHKPISNPRQENYRKLENAINEICGYLATAIVRDGEGASKFVSIKVDQGRTRGECLAIAYAIATSPLVKTALFASDPNWGRILAAIGRAGVNGLDITRITVFLNDCCIVERGTRAAGYTEEAGKRAMRPDELVLRVILGRGRQQATVWTCDLSHEYVRINAEYRS
jgi:glutamate N-acetyltransferase/amino-acid N-acetyltransferase